ncbi:MAG: putative capsular polysaccharide synthesis family protein [Kiritimatiellae bacterium]|nr:putative capsular polysaccharide synthesis family protein [Kiritimatiellia bacterium]
MGWPRNLRNWIVWNAGFCRRLGRYEPVFVYQMGKVASRSIHEPLDEIYPGAVVHGHRFDPEYPQGEVVELYKRWERGKLKLPLHIISLARNPIDRNVSAFFQNFEHYTGQKPREWRGSMRDLLDCFLEVFPHHIPLIWFDHSLKQNFGVDVYARPLKKEGWSVHETKDVRALVMRVEIPDEEKTRAVRSFLELDEFSVARNNKSGKKDYGSLYAKFKKEVKLPRDYVLRMLDSKYFRHFYDSKEAARTLQRWC